MRAGKLQKEYNDKAQGADRRQGVPEGRVGPVESKLISLGKIEGIVAGQFGEVSEATHRLVAALATSRVRVAGPTRGRRGLVRTEEAEGSVAVASIRRRLGVMTVRCQASSPFTKPPLFQRNRLTYSGNPSFESCVEGKA